MSTQFDATKMIREITNELQTRRNVYSAKNALQFFCIGLRLYRMGKLQKRFKKHQKKIRATFADIREDLETRMAKAFAEEIIKKFQED